MVILAPDFDEDTARTRQWAEDLAYRAIVAGHSVRLLPSAANRQEVATALAEVPDVALFYGHGLDDCWLHDRLTCTSGCLVDLTNVASLTADRVIAVACGTSVGLGPQAVHGSVQEYVGFDDDFEYTTYNVAAFGVVANAPAQALLLDGASDLHDATTVAADVYNTLILEFRRRSLYDGDATAAETVICLENNLSRLTVLS